MSSDIQALNHAKRFKSLKSVNIRDYKNNPTNRQAMGMFKHLVNITNLDQAEFFKFMINKMYEEELFRLPLIDKIEEADKDERASNYFNTVNWRTTKSQKEMIQFIEEEVL